MFENLEDAKMQLLRDKHTLLEGYITEYLFEHQFLFRDPGKYTHGWWSAVNDSSRFFFLIKENMNDVDKKVFNLLSDHFPCWIAFPDGNEWKFSDGNSELTKAEFVALYKLKIRRGRLSAAKGTQNTDRQQKCIDFFQRNDIMTQIAIERNFANDFLSPYFDSMVNIDYIVNNSRGVPCVIEVKFKYENRAGNFGINSGQLLMFDLLEKIGFEIYHFILYNFTQNKDLSIFGFLELNADSQNKYWLYGKLSNFSGRNQRIAPEETSVDGKRKQPYYEFGKGELTGKIVMQYP